jgi:hypothetical protein
MESNEATELLEQIEELRHQLASNIEAQSRRKTSRRSLRQARRPKSANGIHAWAANRPWPSGSSEADGCGTC